MGIDRTCTELVFLLLKLFPKLNTRSITHTYMCHTRADTSATLDSWQDHGQHNLQRESEMSWACQTKFQPAGIFPAGCEDCSRHSQLRQAFWSKKTTLRMMCRANPSRKLTVLSNTHQQQSPRCAGVWGCPEPCTDLKAHTAAHTSQNIRLCIKKQLSKNKYKRH